MLVYLGLTLIWALVQVKGQDLGQTYGQFPQRTYGRPIVRQPVDCEIQCGDFGPCSRTCGYGGVQTRQCQIVVQPQNGGRPCGPLSETRPCGSGQRCDQDCLVDYSPFSECDCSGTQTRQGRVIQQVIGNGQQCPPLQQTNPCRKPPQCDPIDCQIQCSEFGPCSRTCGYGGVQTRQCQIVVPPQNGGRPCGPLSETRPCDSNRPCDQDCIVEYSQLSECDCSGTQTREGRIVQQPIGNGLQCLPLRETVQCSQPPRCNPIDCEVVCDPFTQCSSQCGVGVEAQRCVVVQRPQNGGRPCPPLVRSRPCENNARCPVDCVVSFPPFPECECNSQTTRVGVIVQQPQFGGVPCPSLVETQTCNRPPRCDPVDCQIECTEFGPCSRTCGNYGGVQTRQCQIVVPPRNGGRPCGPLSETRPCGTNRPCDQDCIVDYGTFSACDCSGLQQREGRIVQPAIGNGRQCPPLREVVPCQKPPQCDPVDCQIQCSEFGPCSRTCGYGGVQTRQCQIVVQPRNGGRPCGPLSETRPCGSNQPCDQDCLVEYGQYSACDCSSTQTREGRIIQQLVGNGLRCPPLRETVPCQRPPQCEPVDCQIQCGEFESCSRTCGYGGVQTRRCEIVQQPRNGGRPCGPLSETRPCGSNRPCDQDCIVEYSRPSECDCSGTQTREGRIVQQPIGNGQACPPLRSVTPCAKPPQCEPRDCVSTCEESYCSATCGTGVATRTCRIQSEARNGGRPCPPQQEQIPCQANFPCYGGRFF